LEAAGCTDVRTVLTSGNAVFSAAGSERVLQKKIAAAMQEHLGRSFMSFLRPIADLQALLDADPYAGLKLPAAAKRIVTFLPAEPASVPPLPIEREGARIFAVAGREAFSFYLPQPGNPVFMTLLERTFGKDVTTRTWDTVRKVCAAGAA
jgi:uncharacterized protein (DUF1697 family)